MCYACFHMHMRVSSLFLPIYANICTSGYLHIYITHMCIAYAMCVISTCTYAYVTACPIALNFCVQSDILMCVSSYVCPYEWTMNPCSNKCCKCICAAQNDSCISVPNAAWSTTATYTWVLQWMPWNYVMLCMSLKRKYEWMLELHRFFWRGPTNIRTIAR